MVETRSKRARIAEPQEGLHSQQHDEQPDSDGVQEKVSSYEQCREERIKENLETMRKLGILDLSLKLKPLKQSTPKSCQPNRKSAQRTSPLPSRRSSRLMTVTPVSYSENHLAEKDSSLVDEDDFIRGEGYKPEVYTEEHEKMLGHTKMSWTLFVDGYGNDGKRIYDPVSGKTCHQCRQKTLGYRTHCSNCNMVQGQFCGDCLYMRYGEHVLEAKQNPNWICPTCRGICNCSLCRKAKGLPPTGPMYKKITNLGFKSVAHYLIHTCQESTGSENISNAEVPSSAKRSLPFSDIKMTEANECPNSDHKSSVKHESDEKKELAAKTNPEYEGTEDSSVQNLLGVITYVHTQETSSFESIVNSPLHAEASSDHHNPETCNAHGEVTATAVLESIVV